MESVTDLQWQPSLLGESKQPAVDPAFTGLVRHELDEETWVDDVPGWLAGDDEVFAWLADQAGWGQMEITLYGEKKVSPRLVARLPADDLPPPLAEARRLLSARYDVDFDSVGVNLYRDGRDSVAWHGDRVARTKPTATVATLSLGEPRRFLLRPKGGGRSRSFDLGRGDLLVMGGACQRTWQHAVPKVASAGPRMSVTFRHTAYP